MNLYLVHFPEKQQSLIIVKDVPFLMVFENISEISLNEISSSFAATQFPV